MTEGQRRHIVWTPAMIDDLKMRAEVLGQSAAEIAVAYRLNATEAERIYSAAKRFGIRFKNTGGRPGIKSVHRIAVDAPTRTVMERVATGRRIGLSALIQRLIDAIGPDETLINNLLDDTP